MAAKYYCVTTMAFYSYYGYPSHFLSLLILWVGTMYSIAWISTAREMGLETAGWFCFGSKESPSRRAEWIVGGVESIR